MNMKISAVLLIALMVSLPLIQAQEEVIPEEVISDEVIPADIAGVLTGVGGGPAIALILDIIPTFAAFILDIIDTGIAMLLDTFGFIISLVLDVIDTIVAFIMAVWAKGLGEWCVSPIVACICVPFGICPVDSYLMLCWHCCDYIPGLACVPRAWNLVKSICALFLGI